MTDFAKEIIPVNIEDELKQSYLSYALSVIHGRALPDIRDGLKPVHRRILFAMYDLKNSYNKPYKKSARVVGDVIGKYHPHGDSAVYDAMVRMAQDFSLRYTLVEGQGNFGSIDGDPPAAMRYTEVRMAKITDMMLGDLEKETVSFSPNYDGSEFIPDVLPTKIPNLLINGSSGIAVGMATNIPPHNLNEVITGCINLIEDPNLSIDDLIKDIPGPDFPTGGTIDGRAGIYEAYKTGRGIIHIRSNTSIEEDKSGKQSLIIDEIPFMVNKARMLEKIAELVKEKKIEGITEIRDESDKDGLRVVIEVRKGDSVEVLENNLFAQTQLEQSFGINLTVLSKGQPKEVNLKEILEAFIDHRKDVIIKRTKYDLRKAKDRGHIVEGLMVSIANIDEVISIIKKSKDPKVAAEELCKKQWDAGPLSAILKKVGEDACKPEDLPKDVGINGKKYKLSALQAKAILELRLGRLTGLEQDNLNNEFNDIIAKILELQNILDDKATLKALIIDELNDIKNNFGDERKTLINDTRRGITNEDLIPEETRVLTVSRSGYAKTQPLDEYREQRRGGQGKAAASVKEEDLIQNLYVLSSHVQILCFTTKGKVFWLKVYEIPVASRISKGRPLVNMLNLDDDESVSEILPVEEFSEDKFIFMATKKGTTKKTNLSLFAKKYKSGIKAINLDDDDVLIGTAITSGDNEILLASSSGKLIRFSESHVRPMGRTARGVRGITLKKGEKLISLMVGDETKTILCVSENGYGKKTNLDDFPSHNRGGQGVISMKTSDRNGSMVSSTLVEDNDGIMLISDKGTMIRTSVEQVPTLSRNTQGVKIITPKEGEKLIECVTIPQEEEDVVEELE
ncbi:DNA gyrase subunit A [Gammaproteobacteria bacterium]|nr:DNA gyrase subunit A [Gammaproteobacteria bacterium]MDA8957317.1 DNA gyrase subunit A [Gammaproteobacteria bacterium]MDA9842409.1 DNA gyrase subunit A [Gammaproteobacteria bacterium]